MLSLSGNLQEASISTGVSYQRLEDFMLIDVLGWGLLSLLVVLLWMLLFAFFDKGARMPRARKRGGAVLHYEDLTPEQRRGKGINPGCKTPPETRPLLDLVASASAKKSTKTDTNTLILFLFP